MKLEGGESGAKNFERSFVDPEAAEKAKEAQKKAGERLIKAREGQKPGETGRTSEVDLSAEANAALEAAKKAVEEGGDRAEGK
jgi:hypothetical protein